MEVEIYLILSPLILADSKELKIGSGDDLKLFHDGSHSFVHHNGTGALKLKEGSADAVVIDSGVVNLNHSGTTKLSTASNGVSVAGAITSSGGKRYGIQAIFIFICNYLLMVMQSLITGVDGAIFMVLTVVVMVLVIQS